MPAAKKPIDPVAAAYDIRRGKLRMADLPVETQRAVNRVNRFSEGKVMSHAARQNRPTRALTPDTRTGRIVLS